MDDKPRKNDRVVLDVIDLDSRLYGVAKPDGFTVFAAQTLPGEKAAATLIKVDKRYAVAKVDDILVRSSDRCAPVCPYYDKCGGCSAQHMTYQAQLRYKENTVRSAFSHIGGMDDLEIRPIIPAENTLGYRNKAQFPIANGRGKNKVAIGFFRRMSHDVIDMDVCPIQSEGSAACIKAIRDYIDKSSESIYDEKTGKGTLRHLVTRTNRNGEILVTLVINADRLRDESLLVRIFTENVRKLRGITINVNKRRDNVIMGRSSRTIFGEPRIAETLLGKSFSISPLSFFQVNTQQTEKLYAEAAKAADIKEGETLLDIYCGIGTIGITLTKAGVKLIGVESVEDAVKDAADNAKANGIADAEFIAGKAEDVLPRLVKDGVRADVAVLDPPRGGCEETLLSAVAESGVERLVYVSCNPATLARDAALLRKMGFTPKYAQPVDMFPMTEHVETVCLLERKKH